MKEKKLNIQNHLSGAMSSIGRLVAFPLTLTRNIKPKVTRKLASSPGIEYAKGVDTPPEDNTIGLTAIDLGTSDYNSTTFATVSDLLASPKPEWANYRWINVDGLHPYVINELRKAFGFHTLVAEDVLHVPQRPKLEQYPDHSLIVLNMARLEEESLVNEQVSIIVAGDTIITFQERVGDVWDPIRKRIQKPDSRARSNSIWYLAYAMIDAIVDNVYPILENYGEVLNQLEEQAMVDPNPSIQQHIYLIKRELYSLRRAFWPVRELSSKLCFDEASPVDEKVRVYLRDVHDHSLQIIELIESSREMCNSLQDFYISVVSNRMNEVMKALTIMASLFMPITFFAGIYGMNFEHIPELGWQYSYPVFWGLCIATTVILLWYFKKKGWIGK
ncbi:magnesium/cobalt transporter CorA [Pelagicoccus albus]|uniref:Magnesium transport protein CorA n=1 Tax=Pelagicoccus albus TaxID=415222 RepID=A0A7X1B532_9BACT|nr:magnesium/cobalt transporter CorA [Pelagicoccus albus]MBC2604545.1 magnesium/cobalt transporter CorA [Pelagicoccus albus]